MKLVHFEIDGLLVEASQNDSVLDACLRKGLEIDSSCGGSGSCGTCRVFVVLGNDLLGPRNEIEAEMAQDRLFRENERLSCQIFCRDGVRLQTPRSKV